LAAKILVRLFSFFSAHQKNNKVSNQEQDFLPPNEPNTTAATFIFFIPKIMTRTRGGTLISVFFRKKGWIWTINYVVTVLKFFGACSLFAERPHWNFIPIFRCFMLVCFEIMISLLLDTMGGKGRALLLIHYEDNFCEFFFFFFLFTFSSPGDTAVFGCVVVSIVSTVIQCFLAQTQRPIRS
jgi:hypothetical protein